MAENEVRTWTDWCNYHRHGLVGRVISFPLTQRESICTTRRSVAHRFGIKFTAEAEGRLLASSSAPANLTTGRWTHGMQIADRQVICLFAEALFSTAPPRTYSLSNRRLWSSRCRTRRRHVVRHTLRLPRLPPPSFTDSPIPFPRGQHVPVVVCGGGARR